MKQETLIVDLNKCPISDRNGTYGGNAGEKEGVLYNNEYWIIKYPKNIRDLRNVEISYSTSPLSEYIGSHIYEILGYDVHQTILGERNGKIVVGCKDFCEERGSLVEMRTLKNVYNEQLNKILEQNFSSTSDSHKIEIGEVLTHLKYNPVLSQISGITDRFWDMMVIDIFIANNDRNNGNWGVLYTSDGYQLAPVFDNGSSFYNRMSDSKMANMMKNINNFKGTVINTGTVFSKNGHELTAKKIILSNGYPELVEALKRNIPLLVKHFDDIKNFIESIPTTYKGLEVISNMRKEYYLESMKTRLNDLLVPALEKIIVQDRSKSISKRVEEVKQIKENAVKSHKLNSKDMSHER